MPIIWEFPDNRPIAITRIPEPHLKEEMQAYPDLDKETVVLAIALWLQKKTPDLRGGNPVLVKSANLPKNRKTRDQWKLDKSGSAPVVKEGESKVKP